MRKSVIDWFALPVFIALSLVVAGVGAAMTLPALDGWYNALQKPDWMPPNWLFSRVWTALYVLMAFAAWLVWRERRWGGVSLPLTLFTVQLVLNVVWSDLFFAKHAPDLAFVEILFLWLAILGTLLAFWQVRVIAGVLFVPYLVWVTFAAVLNYAVWQMNQ
jgi:tryptophan-rich sensory protein